MRIYAQKPLIYNHFQIDHIPKRSYDPYEKGGNIV